MVLFGEEEQPTKCVRAVCRHGVQVSPIHPPTTTGVGGEGGGRCATCRYLSGEHKMVTTGRSGEMVGGAVGNGRQVTQATETGSIRPCPKTETETPKMPSRQPVGGD